MYIHIHISMQQLIKEEAMNLKEESLEGGKVQEK